MDKRASFVYRQVFAGRGDDFALQQGNGRYVRAGRPLTMREIERHIMGYQTIGSYVIDEAGLCHVVVFDADQSDGLVTLAHLQRRIATIGVHAYLEASRRGGHLWVFFATPLLASHVRAWLLPLCPDGVEFYPKQEQGKGYGSVIRLPFGVHRLTNKRYPFVQWDGVTFSPLFSCVRDGLAWLEHIERVPADRVPEWSPSRQESQSLTPQSFASSSLGRCSGSPSTIHAWCATQDPFSLIGSFVMLNSRGIGCCPFGDHHRQGADRHPSLKVYAPRRPGGSSWYCYAWGRGGNVFDFLCLWYRLESREMWRHIQAEWEERE